MRFISILLITLLTAAASLSAQVVLRVDASALPGGDGESWSTAFFDLQSALAMASSPGATVEEIWVRAGAYTPGPEGAVDATFQLIDGVGIYGGFLGTETDRGERDIVVNETILSGDLAGDDTFVPGTGWTGYAENSAHIVTASGTDSTAVLDGFTVEGGALTNAVPLGGYGSGLFNIGGTPTVRNCTFRRNYAGRGGAIYHDAPTISIEGCTFEDNIAWLGFGGGVYGASGHMVIQDCSFQWNEAVGGGTSEGGGAGIATWLGASCEVARSVFRNNTARNFYASGDSNGAYGGGFFSFGSGSSVIDCVFEDNFAHAGAGVYNWGDQFLVANCLFFANEVHSYEVNPVVSRGGGGAGVAVTGSADRTTQISGCTFVANSGEEGVGVIGYGSHLVEVVNSIFWNNPASEPEVVGLLEHVKGETDVAYCCVENLWDVAPGEDPLEADNFPGCFDSNPLFVNPLALDYRLSAGSPCIDAGDNDGVFPGVVTDLEGNERRVDDPGTVDTGVGVAPIVDLGPYEFGAGSVAVEFLRGDGNDDGAIDVSDPVFALGALFQSTPVSCWDALDSNDDGGANIADVVFLLAHIFEGGSAPPAPFPQCGVDPTLDGVDCANVSSCP